MKYCAKCGAELSENNKFCEKCGNKVNEDFPDNGNKKIRAGKIVAVAVVAAIIAVACYLQYTKSQKDSDSVKEASIDSNEGTYEVSNEDMYSEDDIFADKEDNGESQTGKENTQTNGEDVENLGENSIDFASEVKLNREQIRSQNKASLLEVINNVNITEEQKQDAINAMIAMTDIAEREAAAEMLLEAKGFTDVVVSITDDKAEVVLNMGEATDAKRMQVEDIVKRKMNIAEENIMITPIQNLAKEGQTGKESDQANNQNEDVENPGEAVLSSTNISNVDFTAEVKLNREQIRSQNKAFLLEVINNVNITEEQKQDAVNAMIAMTDIADREAAAEMLLEAKGFTDVVVSIIDDNAEVVLNMGEVTDAKRAQVEDIVKRKTNIAEENIIITPIQNLAKEGDSTEENEAATEAEAAGADSIGAEGDNVKYIDGVYTSPIQLNDNTVDIEVVVEENHITSITLVNMDETTASMYPLTQPALDNLTQQIYEKQSLENISYGDDNQYTSMVLLNAIESALNKARYEKE